MISVCKNCAYWKPDTKGLCTLTNEGVGQLWKCDQWKSVPSKILLPPQCLTPEGTYSFEFHSLSETFFLK